MCGRYTLVDSDLVRLGLRFLFDPEALAGALPDALAGAAGGLAPRYNIAPSQPVLAVLGTADGGRRPALLRWGLIPPWAPTPRPGPVNARAETAATRPTFRSAMRRRRCLVPADGYFEWRAEGRRKQPFRFTLRDGGVFAFAGLWERWQGAAGTVDSCCILTTEPNALGAPVHDRMPVILRPESETLWCDVRLMDPVAAAAACRPYPAEDMAAYPVSSRVNSPRNDDEGCIRPLG